MQPITRRGFISGTAAGLAAAGVALAVPGQMAGASVLSSKRAGHDAADTITDSAVATGSLSEPLIAHVRDLSSGEIALFSGEREIVIRDRHLASKLASATGGR